MTREHATKFGLMGYIWSRESFVKVGLQYSQTKKPQNWCAQSDQWGCHTRGDGVVGCVAHFGLRPSTHKSTGPSTGPAAPTD